MLSVSEDGVPPVHLLHDVWVHTVLLRGDTKRFNLMSEFMLINLRDFTVDVSLVARFTLMSLMSCRVGVSMGVLLSMTP